MSGSRTADLKVEGHLSSRILQLFSGLTLFGVSLALMVRAQLGLGAWDVLHQGIARRTGLQLGWIVIAVGAAVLIAWIPLRQVPGPGTIANVLVVGAVTNAALALLPPIHGAVPQGLFLVAGVLANGLATGLYIGAGLGPGPRDGLMMGLARRGLRLRTARTVVEVAVLAAGFALGGTVGIGTILYTATIGPLAGYWVPRLTRSTAGTDRDRVRPPNTELSCST